MFVTDADAVPTNAVAASDASRLALTSRPTAFLNPLLK
jgi:hypothetical protein